MRKVVILFLLIICAEVSAQQPTAGAMRAANRWNVTEPVWKWVTMLDCQTETKLRCAIRAGARCESEAERQRIFVDFNSDYILGPFMPYGVKILGRTFQHFGDQANSHDMKIFIGGGKEHSKVMSLKYRITPNYEVSDELDATTVTDYTSDLIIHQWQCTAYVKK